MEFGDFVKVLRGRERLSYRKFAAGINEYLRSDDKFTHQTVSNWEHGLSRPTCSLLYYVLQHAPLEGWQREFAKSGLDILKSTDVISALETDNVELTSLSI